jgi:hypothetical protein
MKPANANLARSVLRNQRRYQRNARTSAIARAAGVALVMTFGAAPAAFGQHGPWENPDGQPGSLSRANLAEDHAPHPVDLTGTYTPEGFWEFEPYPQLKPAARAHYDRVRAGSAAGRTFNDVTGDCWPPGMPIIMTRVWPFHVIPLKTAIVMVFNFNSQVRWIFVDGRTHSDPNIYVPSYNGESIGWWEGDTLVVDTRNFETHQHYIDRLVPLSEEFRIIERIRSIDQGDRLEIEFTMTDPENWEGEWVVTKTFRRQERVDWAESQCLPNTNEGLPAMQSEYVDRLDVDQP